MSHDITDLHQTTSIPGDPSCRHASYAQLAERRFASDTEPGLGHKIIFGRYCDTPDSDLSLTFPGRSFRTEHAGFENCLTSLPLRACLFHVLLKRRSHTSS